MTKETKGLNRREFIELSVAGTAAISLSPISAVAAEPKRGGTVNACIGWLIQTPDPHRWGGGWARRHMSLVYEGLTQPTSMGDRLKAIQEKSIAAVGDVKPMLAESWEIENNGKRYVFHLKKGVKFHNGKELDSEDIKWNYQRIQDPANLAHGRGILTMFLDSMETPDKYTFVANLTQSYGGFLMANAWVNAPILPKDCVPKGVIWGQTKTFTPPTAGPPGTGPFILAEYKQKYRAVYDAFKDYRVKGLPYLDRVIYNVITQETPRTLALRAGNVQFAIMLEANYLSRKLKGQKTSQVFCDKKEGLCFYTTPYKMSPYTLYLNCHDTKGGSPFKDVRVRQALDYCLDREKLAKAVWGDLAVPLGQPFNPQVSPWGYSDISYRKRDIEKARQLLKEAGYPNGVDVNFYITTTFGKQSMVAQVVQQMAAPAGLRIKIITEMGLQYWGRLTSMNYHILHYSLGFEDPMKPIFDWLHTDQEKPYNGYAPVTGLKDPVLDKLLDQVAAEDDFKKRRDLFKKAVLRIQDQAEILPYLSPIYGWGWTDKLKNVDPNKYFWPEQALREAWLES
ncbi:MAG: ABC transporter substrate-binding protein [Deltaproteobacteria bacterium]|nr:ABC transporter substrate-binding protein [Deltaproteobacteria bacterium]